MKNLALLLIIMSIVGCSSKQPVSQLKLKYFHITAPQNDWESGYSAEDDLQAAEEYVIKGENVYNWSKLVTEQHAKVFQKELLFKYVQITEAKLRENSKGFYWNVLEKKENSVVYEWAHNGSGTFPPTYEICKLVAENNALYRLSFDKYTTNRNDLEVLKWKSYILNSTLKQIPVPATHNQDENP